MEKIYYELKPFICIALSLWGLHVARVMVWGKASAIILLGAGALILYARLANRGFLNK